ncbi:PREDICTED: olfactory receptor 10AG1-like [Nanorana parkeri]|uniref:olfactory receptor 10AG1-like n=1 Tax=Nanorana parkeri TaxID=125878 RepID=UPI000854A896|nr:PREDICTED: olfactory receptor 10AG1-like [Nanorana parkeri]
MDGKNHTLISMIHLLGFQSPENLTLLFFFIFLMIYSMTMCANLLIITLVLYGRTLHSPMYFFLSQLAVSDMLLATDILPNMLHAILMKGTIISLANCITQFFFFGVSETLESLLLTVMSYDRYLAICKPLYYALIMNDRVCWIMVITSWMSTILIILVLTLTISQLQFCEPNIIDHFYCDLDPILQLSCSVTTAVQLEVTLLSALFVVMPFFIIIISYVYIIVTIFEISSITERKKAFSTCSSHLAIVSIYYGTLVCVYLVASRGQLWNIGKFPSLLYTVFIPLLNPMIYSLRNKDLKKVLGKLISNSLNMQRNRRVQRKC